jgi:hypothetical protein
VEITCRIYRPRRPRESPLYRLVETHLEELLRLWPQRFARSHGCLRPVVERVLRRFLECGLLEHGFARLWCGECRRSVLVAFSCRGRSFCSSCEKKKQLLWAEWLRPIGAWIGSRAGRREGHTVSECSEHAKRAPERPRDTATRAATASSGRSDRVLRGQASAAALRGQGCELAAGPRAARARLRNGSGSYVCTASPIASAR